MKPKTLLALTCVAVLMGGFIVFFEKDLPSTDERRELDTKVLDLKADQVEEIRLQQGEGLVVLVRDEPDRPEGEETVTAGPQEPKWRLLEPIATRADSAGVEDLLSRLVSLSKSRDLEGADPAELGIGADSRTVSLSGPAGERRLRLGTAVPLSTDLAVEREDGRLLQSPVGSELLALLDRSSAEWRDKRLFVGRRNAVETVTLHRADGVIRFRRSGEGERFRLVEPLTDHVDSDRLRGFLGTVTGLEADTFSRGRDEHGLNPPLGSIELGFGDAEPSWTLQIGRPPGADEDGLGDDRLWVAASTAVDEEEVAAILDTAVLDALQSPVDGWRSKKWTDFQVFSVDRATFEGPLLPQPVELQRNSGEWHRGDEVIEYTLASDALYPMTEIRAVALLDRDQAAGRFQLDAPRLQVTLGNDSREDVLSLYSVAGNEVAATLDGREAVLLLPADEIDAWISKILALIDASPVSE